MKLKQFGCGLGFFIVGLVLLFILLAVGNQNPTAFWIIIGVLAVGIGVAARIVRTKADRRAAEGAPEENEPAEKPLVILDPDAPKPEEDTAPQEEEIPAEAEADAPVEPIAVAEGENVMSAGSYVVGTDLPAGKYDFQAVRGSGTLRVVKADGEERFSVAMGTKERTESAAYRNLVCEEGESLVIDGSLAVTVRKARMLVIE